ncbi:MAG: hypothetical protein DMG16_25615 [Acidobacteria bacterium]|nr:MAG: hypothetical protein DMG16_25615 [Acidobacteriota bacterium]
MSQANLTMKDLFEVQSAKDVTEGMGTAQELEASQGATALKEEVAKKSRLIQWSAVQDVLVEKTLEAVDIPVLTFLLPAWKKYRDIVEFVDLEKHPANEVNLVSLAQHRVKVEHHPYLQVTYRGVEIPKAKLEFALTGDLTLEGVILKIQNGKIKAIQGGAMKWSGELLLENRSVLKKESKSYALTGKVDLGEGIPL